MDEPTSPEAGHPPAEELEPHRDFQRRLRDLTPRLYLTPAIIAINAVVFAVMIASGVDVLTPTTGELLSWGANYAPRVMDGEWWRLITGNYLHIGFVHLALNMFVLWDVGRIVERMLGHFGFALVYLLSGFCGSLATIIWTHNAVSAGASGAVFGICGCLLGYLSLGRSSIPRGALKRLSVSTALFVGYNVLYGLGAEGVDMAAHLGGLAAGFACGLALHAPIDPAARTIRNEKLRNLTIAAPVAAVALLAVAVNAASGSADVRALPDDKISYGAKQDVYYGDGATEADARKLGDALDRFGFFEAPGGKTLILERDGEALVLSMVVDESAWSDTRKEQMVSLGAFIANDVFGGASFRLRLLSEKLELLQSIEPAEMARAAPAGAEAGYVFGLDVDRARESELFRRFEPKVREAIGAAELAELRDACGGDLFELFDAFELWARGDGSGALLVASGMEREAFASCLRGVAKVEGVSLEIEDQGELTVVEVLGEAWPLYWLTDDAVALGARLWGERPGAVLDASQLVRIAEAHAELEEDARLADMMERARGRSLWFAAVARLGDRGAESTSWYGSLGLNDPVELDVHLFAPGSGPGALSLLKGTIRTYVTSTPGLKWLSQELRYAHDADEAWVQLSLPLDELVSRFQTLAGQLAPAAGAP